MATVRWPQVLSPSYLAQLIRQQKNPLTALQLFQTAPLRYPSYRHNSLVYSAMADQLLSNSSPPRLSLLRSLLSQMVLDSSPASDPLFARAISSSPSPAAALPLLRLLPLSNCPSWPLSLLALLRLLLSLPPSQRPPPRPPPPRRLRWPPWAKSFRTRAAG